MERELRSVTVAVGTYEGGLLVYQIDLFKALHVPLFTSKDNEVKHQNFIPKNFNFPFEFLFPKIPLQTP